MILVIEDDPVLARVMSASLKRRALAHVIAVTGVEGHERAGRTPPDLIICDLGLPDIGGLALITMLRKLPRMSGVPIIVCTGDASRETVQGALAAGATDYIAKPIDLLLFEERVLKAMRAQRAVSVPA